MIRSNVACVLLSLLVCSPAFASDFPRLDEALPSAVDVAVIAPVFDFDGDGCLPSAGISRSGEQNGGLNPSGSVTGDCRYNEFLGTSNTVHRYACVDGGGSIFCGHFYALYFEKDQISDVFGGGHRHDWEHAAIWTTDGVVTHGSYSAHGDLTTAPASALAFENGHLKVVYHKDGAGTHAFRFAGSNETAENPYGAFVTPAIISWHELYGDGLSNADMRERLDSFDYGSANLPVRSSAFLANLNEFRPAGYPEFAQESVLNPNPATEYVQIVNQASGLCMDINEAVMDSGTNVLQWYCHGGTWQKWRYEPSTGLIRSLHDPNYCLDNTGIFENGANLIIWACNGNDHQRFILNGDDSLGMRVLPSQVVDGYGANAGDNIGTWENWGGLNQKWSMVP